MSPNSHRRDSDDRHQQSQERYLSRPQQQQQEEAKGFVHDETTALLLSPPTAVALGGPCHASTTPAAPHLRDGSAYASLDKRGTAAAASCVTEVAATTTTTTTTPCCTTTRPWRSNSTPPFTNQPWNRDALYFGIRMAVCMTISSLFALWQPSQPGNNDSLSSTHNNKYPQAMWVLITVLFVCWFPSLDAASVVEKSLQRLYGTFIGATVGLLCGFLSLLVEGPSMP